MLEKESFEELYNESLKNNSNLEKIVTGKIIKITAEGEIFVDLGYKADGIIPKKEYSNNLEANPKDEFKIGDEITAEVLKLNDGTGNVLLSYKRIKASQDKERFAKKVADGEVFEAKINQINEKGIVTESCGTRVFIPISLSGIRKEENLENYKGKTITFEIVEYDPENRKVIGSHRIIEEKVKAQKENEFWSSIEIGKEYEGKVVTISSYGVFVDLNGAHGLLHCSEFTWRKNADLNIYFKIGEEIKVSIKDIDKENKKIQLSYANKEVSPWENAENKYNVGDIVKGKVKKLLQFGAIIEIEDGIDALVHISQISEERISKPEQKLELDEVVEAKIIGLDVENRKMELSIKAVHEEDWRKELANIEGVTFELKD